MQDVIWLGGLAGGSAMSVALTRRARTIMKRGDTDLSAEAGMDCLLEMLPNQAVKIGYLLDLGRSSFADRYQSLILQALLKSVDSISSIRDILSPGSTDDDIVKAIYDVRSRIGDDVLGREIGDLLSKKLDEFMNDQEGSEPQSQAPIAKPAAAPKKKASNKRTCHSGEVIFKEGDIGDEAFMIMSGEVEISIETGNGAVTLAKLGRGEIFGEMALIDDQPRMATATSLAETTLSAVPEEAFKKGCPGFPRKTVS